MKKRRIFRAISGSALTLLTLTSSPFVFADTGSSEEINQLQSEIQNRKAQIETINGKLDEYKKKINEYASKSSSLENQIAILENETAMTELDVAATQNAVEEENLHLQILDDGINEASTKLAKQKQLLTDLLFEMNKQDKHGGTFEMIIGARDFNEVFSSASQLQSVNSDLKKALSSTQQTKQSLESKKNEREQHLASLSDLQVQLDEKIAHLDADVSAKEVLKSQTEESEAEYTVLLSELRQEQQQITQRINQLQEDIDNKLADSDEAVSGETVITWPVTGRITTLFHDPTYPFRYLFEHSGLDIAVPQGTPIEAAAPGYVAWAQTGRDYGNYVMIIHANGLATLYAHMSRIDVTVDQYVSRGEIIGLSGGRPGTQGAGFSTGPHVHFEVRKNGIPVDPMPYLP